jgi:DNA-binding CsgD family transcriptional regulator
VRLLRAGKQPTYKEIAHQLGIAESTARVLGSRALRKLGGRRLRLPEV